MARKQPVHKPTPLKRRTTLTLPSESLRQAQAMATLRQVNLSTVISEVIAEGLKVETGRHRSAQILEGYRQAFDGFSDDELAILDGIVLEPVLPRRP